ncbi:DUF664 domain-containing protein [Aeromicrobium ginsengisoli]|uniref:DUF664 domain-containing protein n=1 Tax=Aeromicrobium ginsengisoli TaxID=363867 RepID=A0A5M4FIJ9_9ACTN|nr:DUF664 domain-containing protein [Aeromicrobium ginsengisoli]KAA1399792.1 DUF664 domain-containing protein [Aeromicrobium ginsengisoli]
MNLPEPGPAVVDPAARFLDYLDYFRAEVRRKVADLDDADLGTSRVPSGWSPAGLVSHLVHMERRWFVWGFLGEDLADPWGERDESDEPGRWTLTGPVHEMLDALDAGGRRTREIVASHALHDRAATGGRFPEGEPAPTLMSILFHVMQEYARHMGHLDVVRELIDGTTGEG